MFLNNIRQPQVEPKFQLLLFLRDTALQNLKYFHHSIAVNDFFRIKQYLVSKEHDGSVDQPAGTAHPCFCKHSLFQPKRLSLPLCCL